MAAVAPARIAPVDSLRGFALFGLFVVHMIEYFELYWMSPPAQPTLVHQIIFGLFGGKAYALLALCFGFSFHILFDRAREKGENFAGRFAWRMSLLFLFGVVHAEIYRGDIITVLAVFGLLMAAEAAGAMLIFGRSLAEHATSYARPAGAIGLAGQTIFALIPVLRQSRGVSGKQPPQMTPPPAPTKRSARRNARCPSP